MSTSIKTALQAATVISFLALGACGGGGSDTTPPPPAVTAPSGLSYTTPDNYQTGQSITPLTPTVTGTVTSYSVSPALPAGLSLNTTTGAIAGTPTAVTASATYTVTATNSGGSTTAAIVVAVSAPPTPATVTYDAGYNYTFTVGDPIDAVIPTVSGGTIATWSISPTTLPTGLAFNTANGTITGTPAEASSAATYTVTAKTADGASTTSTLVLQVQTGLLVELGQTGTVTDLRVGGSRMLSRDSGGYWTLWNYTAGAVIAHGQSVCPPTTVCLPLDMTGPTVAIGTPTGIDLYNTNDGTVLSRITANLSWWKLSSDGGYIVGGNNNGLYVWNPAGLQLAVKSGDYHQAQIVAMPAKVLVALGAQGTDAIESVDLPTGTSTVTSSFQGTFKSWFADGSHFLTSTGTTWWVYSNTAIQQDLKMLPAGNDVGGQGNFFWSASETGTTTLDLYKVGDSASTAYSTTNVNITKVDGEQLFLQAHTPPAGTQSIQEVDLSGNTPVASSYNLPDRVSATAVAGTVTGVWAVGGTHGLIVDGSTLGMATQRYLGFGEVYAVVGSANRFAIATALGQINYYNVGDNTLAGVLSFPATKLALSADGSVLIAGAQTVGTDRTVNVYSLPAGTITHSWPGSTTTPPWTSDFTLSGSGTVLAQILTNGQGLVAPTNGGATIWTGPLPSGGNFPFLWLSPDGTQLAVPDLQSYYNATTAIYTNGVLATAVNGLAVGWLDNDRLLVNHYGQSQMAGSGNLYTGATLVSPTGTQLATTQLTDLRVFTPVTSDTVYAPAFNKIFSVSTGNTVWSSPNPATIVGNYGLGAVADSKVVFVSRTIVRAETH